MLKNQNNGCVHTLRKQLPFNMVSSLCSLQNRNDGNLQLAWMRDSSPLSKTTHSTVEGWRPITHCNHKFALKPCGQGTLCFWHYTDPLINYSLPSYWIFLAKEMATCAYESSFDRNPTTRKRVEESPYSNIFWKYQTAAKFKFSCRDYHLYVCFKKGQWDGWFILVQKHFDAQYRDSIQASAYCHST